METPSIAWHAVLSSQRDEEKTGGPEGWPAGVSAAAVQGFLCLLQHKMLMV